MQRSQTETTRPHLASPDWLEWAASRRGRQGQTVASSSQSSPPSGGAEAGRRAES